MMGGSFIRGVGSAFESDTWWMDGWMDGER